MELIDIEMIKIPAERKITLNQIIKKESEIKNLKIDKIPPILIDRNEIVDGVKRFLVLKKWEIKLIPVERINRTGKINLNTKQEDKKEYYRKIA
ncbi:hypothetical protein [Cloacibacterium sp. TD35]|uniref:hypothetical protein n=1 Tax=Cloacibacterium sp. TD35 TaxID=2976818 RepID=UPI00237E0D7B|nr:hypothetical protein [Cloacibacterium sp. TD35]WDT67220.1 hypothetical protein N7277_07715 [Cloacibacterium sp. TD35]